jgi:hypothetical protein
MNFRTKSFIFFSTWVFVIINFGHNFTPYNISILVGLNLLINLI